MMRSCTTVSSVAVKAFAALALALCCLCAAMPQDANATVQIYTGYTYDDETKTVVVVSDEFGKLSSVAKDAEHVVINEGVTTIKGYAFSGKASIKDVSLPSTLKSVGEFAFRECTSLEEVVLPEGLTVIDKGAFYGCTSLKSINLPSTLTTLGATSLAGVAIESVIVPSGVKSFGNAFIDCLSLKTVVLSQGVTSIDAYAFVRDCSLEAILVPSSLKSINASAFSDDASPVDLLYQGSEADKALIQITGGKLDQRVTWYCNHYVFHEFDHFAKSEQNCEHGDLTQSICKLGEAFKTVEVGEGLGHDFGDWIETTPATCEDDGELTRTCSRCGFTEADAIGALGHDYGDPVFVSGNCTAGATLSEECSVCGYVREYNDRLANHEFRDPVFVSGNCVEGVELSKECSRCGYVEKYSDQFASHDFANWTIAVKETSTNPGKKVRECQLCGETETAPVGKKHTWRTTYTIDKKPTYISNGSKSIHCTRCSLRMDKTSIPKLEKTRLDSGPEFVKVVLSTKEYVYNGKVKKPSVKLYVDGKYVSSKHYTVSYSSGRKKVGTYKVTIKARTGNHPISGSVSATFKINPPKTKITKIIKSAEDSSVTISWYKKTTYVQGYAVFIMGEDADLKNIYNADVVAVEFIQTNKTTKCTLSVPDGFKGYAVVVTYKDEGDYHTFSKPVWFEM